MNGPLKNFHLQIRELQFDHGRLPDLGHGSSHRFRHRRDLRRVRERRVSGEQLRRRSGQALRLPASGEQDYEDCGLGLSGEYLSL